MTTEESEGKNERVGLSNQALVGLLGILLLIFVPLLSRDARWLIAFLSLLIAPPLIMFFLRWLEGRIGMGIPDALIYFPLSVSWIVLGIIRLADGPLWLDPFWLPQGIIGLVIGAGLIYGFKWAYLAGVALAVLGLRAIATNGLLPLISAILSAGAMLYLEHPTSLFKSKYVSNLLEVDQSDDSFEIEHTNRLFKMGFGRSRTVALIVFGIAILIMLPFPFAKPTFLKATEGYKISAIQRYSEKITAGEETNLKPLMRAMDDLDGLVRAEAVRQLGSIAQMRKEEESADLNTIIDALVPMIDDTETREITISQLAAIGNERAVEFLIESIRHYPDMDVRLYNPIFNIFSEYSAQLLIELLADFTGSGWHEIRVRRQAVILLGNVREPRVAKAIAKYLGDESRDVRQAAANSLGRMYRQDAVEVLMDGLQDSNYRVRRSAAKMLAKPRLSAGVKFARAEALVEATKDADAYVRKYAVQAIGNLSDERSLDTLLNALADEDQNVRKRAVRALGNIRSESSVDPLIAALEDKYIRRDAAGSLGKTGDPRGVNAAVEAMAADLRNEDMRVSIAAAETLGKIGSEDAVSPLINALRDTRWRVREVAASALGNIGADYAVQPLIETLYDSEPSVRRAAAEAIRGSDNSQAIALAIEAMLKDLNNRDPRVRESAAEALGRLGGRKAVPYLKRAAKEDGINNVRRVAASALTLLTNIQIEHWLMIGPFDNTNRGGFEKQYPPEREIDLSAVYDGKGQKVRWTKYTEGKTSSLLPFFKPNQNMVVYALTYIISPDDREVVFRAGSDDGIKVWLNDSLVWSNDIYRGLDIDSDVFPVRLKSGRNKVLIKLVQGTLDCGFYFRVTDSDGIPFDDLEYVNPLELSGQT